MSGDGAAARGGRFNPRGMPALYLALTVEGMLMEIAHGFAHRFDPLTICAYDVDVDDLVDLRTDADREAFGIALEDLACPWFLDLSSGRRPASWSLTEVLMGRGASGILVPSFARGARSGMDNLVLWRWDSGLPHKVQVYDPAGRLPRNPLSWGGG